MGYNARNDEIRDDVKAEAMGQIRLAFFFASFAFLACSDAHSQTYESDLVGQRVWIRSNSLGISVCPTLDLGHRKCV
jgi:hypothetical protein